MTTLLKIALLPVYALYVAYVWIMEVAEGR